MKAVTVRLEDDVHRAVKVKAAQEGVAMEALARKWFEQYLKDTTKPQTARAPQEFIDEIKTVAGCSRAARHHINHSGKPCPECGYPLPRDES